MKFLDRIDFKTLILMSIIMLALPIKPMPHIIEKLIMLKEGTLTRGIDIFDLFYHLSPTILLILKIVRENKLKIKK